MPRLEGGPRELDKRMKSKGLQRLRWFCQVCEKQCRSENSFKQHTLSESHVRRLQIVGENSQKYIGQYTRDFQQNFLYLLRTTHGEKPVHLNTFYQSYITDKYHIHLNATRFQSLTEFAKYLGREGICRITDDEEKGLFIAWIDNSPEKLRRQETMRKRDRMDKTDEEREGREIQAQIVRAQQNVVSRQSAIADQDHDHQLPEGSRVGFFKLPSLEQENIPRKRANVFSALKRQHQSEVLDEGRKRKRKASETEDLTRKVYVPCKLETRQF